MGDGTVGARQAAAPAQVVVGGIGAAQGDGADRVGQAGAHVFLCKRAIAAHGDHVIGLQPGQAQRHAVHAGVAVIGFADPCGGGG